MPLLKFPHVHLLAGGWYLDYSRGFVPEVENPFTTALLALPLRCLNWKKSRKKIFPLLNPLRRMLRPSKVRARVGRLSPMHLPKFLLVLTPRLPFNALLLQPLPWLEVLPPFLQSLSPIHYQLRPTTAQPSHRCLANVRLLHRIHRQLPQRSSSLSLIENVDMEELIEDFFKTKIQSPAYRRIQEFLTKVCMLFFCFILSFLRVQYLFFCCWFYLHMFFSGWSRYKPKVVAYIWWYAYTSI